MSTFYKILIEPAKSNKSLCKTCKHQIQQNSLRIKVCDARKFNAYIKKHGRQNCQGQGMSRGYFQCAGPKGQCISIQKYYVHMQCYKPIEHHPFQKSYFNMQGFKKDHKQTFQKWLQEKNESTEKKPEMQMKSKKQMKQNKKQAKKTQKN